MTRAQIRDIIVWSRTAKPVLAEAPRGTGHFFAYMYQGEVVDERLAMVSSEEADHYLPEMTPLQMAILRCMRFRRSGKI